MTGRATTLLTLSVPHTRESTELPSQSPSTKTCPLGTTIEVLRASMMFSPSSRFRDSLCTTLAISAAGGAMLLRSAAASDAVTSCASSRD
eukprot:CAMPEP_0183377378 /NCGR_PEP_ID=MMETSP0164_2-20130417/122873_1 /TAXON_ID=221442 /ORGANISM="Coccolithus pelagicus ssp braarudi, Strain PLY182g" /LENGTH=89 /DNA_ID=CAMNT_0025554823 /DNA_START=172 /DNA_END=441 /DNA_ORIENTATION=+